MLKVFYTVLILIFLINIFVDTNIEHVIKRNIQYHHVIGRRIIIENYHVSGGGLKFNIELGTTKNHFNTMIIFYYWRFTKFRRSKKQK